MVSALAQDTPVWGAPPAGEGVAGRSRPSKSRGWGSWVGNTTPPTWTLHRPLSPAGAHPHRRPPFCGLSATWGSTHLSSGFKPWEQYRGAPWHSPPCAGECGGLAARLLVLLLGPACAGNKAGSGILGAAVPSLARPRDPPPPRGQESSLKPLAGGAPGRARPEPTKLVRSQHSRLGGVSWDAAASGALLFLSPSGTRRRLGCWSGCDCPLGGADTPPCRQAPTPLGEAKSPARGWPSGPACPQVPGRRSPAAFLSRSVLQQWWPLGQRRGRRRGRRGLRLQFLLPRRELHAPRAPETHWQEAAPRGPAEGGIWRGLPVAPHAAAGLQPEPVQQLRPRAGQAQGLRPRPRAGQLLGRQLLRLSRRVGRRLQLREQVQ